MLLQTRQSIESDFAGVVVRSLSSKLAGVPVVGHFHFVVLIAVGGDRVSVRHSICALTQTQTHTI